MSLEFEGDAEQIEALYENLTSRLSERTDVTGNGGNRVREKP